MTTATITTRPQAATITTKYPTLWTHLDAINCAADETDDGPGPLARAIDAVASVRAALKAGKPCNAGLLATVLDGALRELQGCSKAVAGFTDALGVLEGWADLRP